MSEKDGRLRLGSCYTEELVKGKSESVIREEELGGLYR